MSSHRAPAVRGHRRVARSRTHRLAPFAFGVALLGVGGVVGPGVVDNVTDRDGRDPRSLAFSALPSDAPAQGLIYDGLRTAGAGTLCAGSYAIDAITCTHGPDAVPAGLDVRTSVDPVAAATPAPAPPVRESAAVPADAEIARDAGGSARTPSAPALIPDAAPGDADFVMGTHGVACEGDGHAGKRIQALYVYEPGTPTRYAGYLASMRTWAAGADQIFDASAGETGASRHLRFVTTPECRVDLDEVQVPAGTLKSFATTIDALRTLGYNRTDRKYLLFADANVYCGIGTYLADRRPGLGNRNNGGPSYGRVDAGCWSGVMAAHEITTMLGATLLGSPHSTPAGGCTDEYDLLCGPDRSGEPVGAVCPRTHENRLDCGHDDYFSTDPAPGSYLAKNWNVAQSEFLLRSDGGDDIPDAPGAVPADPASPAPAPATPSAPPAATASPRVSTAAPAPGSAAPSPPADLPRAPDASAPAPSPSAEPPPVQGQDAATVKQAVAKVAPSMPVAAEPVQAVIEVRDATSGSVRLNWSPAAETATYQVSVDGAPIATTDVTRARLVGLRPDARYRVTITSVNGYAAQAVAETAPAARPAQNSWFLLQNALAGGAADLYAARTADGTPITLSSEADGNAQQQWQLVPAAGGGYTLQGRATTRCVVPLGGAFLPGTPLVQGDCANGAIWQLQASEYGFTLRTRTGDLVAGVGAQRYGSRRVLALQTGNGQRHQSWTALPN